MEPYYADGLVTLYHGDALEVTEWLETDFLVIDPPYGRSWRQAQIGGHALNDQSVGISNDRDTAIRDEILEMWGTDRPAAVFGDLMLAPPAGNKLTCVYHKKDGAAGIRGAIGSVRRDCEAIYLVGKWPSGIGGRSSLFTAHTQITGSRGVVARNGGHPHTKANEVMEELLALRPGRIADPTAGSGSTLVAAKRLGRPAIGVELEERFCEMAAKRLDQGVLDFGGVA